MTGYELIKEFYKYNEETKRDQKFTHICGIVDNEIDRDLWLKKMTPFNTYHKHYGYHTISEI
jgi:hypothetical protein